MDASSADSEGHRRRCSTVGTASICVVENFAYFIKQFLHKAVSKKSMCMSVCVCVCQVCIHLCAKVLTNIPFISWRYNRVGPVCGTPRQLCSL